MEIVDGRSRWQRFRGRVGVRFPALGLLLGLHVRALLPSYRLARDLYDTEMTLRLALIREDETTAMLVEVRDQMVRTGDLVDDIAARLAEREKEAQSLASAVLRGPFDHGPWLDEAVNLAMAVRARSRGPAITSFGVTVSDIPRSDDV